MPDILQNIVEKKKEDLSKNKKRISFKDFESMPGFESKRKSLKQALLEHQAVSIIAEIKKASPSKGIIREDFDPVYIAESYIENGASALSVLTDEPFFQGSIEYLEMVSNISTIPVLRKDFIIDPYQIKEAAAYGADSVLLIATICSSQQLSELIAAAKEFQIEVLVECYLKDELTSLNWDEITIVGVNNRNLKTFEVDLLRGVEILNEAPNHVVKVSESGLHDSSHLYTLWKNKINSALIGEHFMKKRYPGLELRKMVLELKEKIKQNFE